LATGNYEYFSGITHNGTSRAIPPGKILIESKDNGKQEGSKPILPITGPFGLVFAIVAYFGVAGIHITIGSESPPQSGLGGSGAIADAIIGAIRRALSMKNDVPENLHEIVLLAHHIEDSSYANTGLEDQAAAAYGGIQLWEWKYGDCLDYSGQELAMDSSELEKYIALAYTGKLTPYPIAVVNFCFISRIRVIWNSSAISRDAPEILPWQFKKAIMRKRVAHEIRSLLYDLDVFPKFFLKKMNIIPGCRQFRMRG
jgi:hypothetical protein